MPVTDADIQAAIARKQQGAQPQVQQQPQQQGVTDADIQAAIGRKQEQQVALFEQLGGKLPSGPLPPQFRESAVGFTVPSLKFKKE
ncbi:hypothetical protein LCGC14_2284810, partial [marine sediment metagenome]